MPTFNEYVLTVFVPQRGGKPILLGPTELRERLCSWLQVKTTPQEVTLLMKKFDTEGRGVVDLRDIFGNALLVSKKRGGGKREDMSRSSWRDTDCGKSSHTVTSRQGNIRHSRQATLQRAEEKLATVAAQMLCGSRSAAVLRSHSESRISGIEFRHLLKGLECGLSGEEEKLVERRYMHVPSRKIEMVGFWEDLKRLGHMALRRAGDGAAGGRGGTSMESVITTTDSITSNTGDAPIELQHAVRVTMRDGMSSRILDLCQEESNMTAEIATPAAPSDELTLQTDVNRTLPDSAGEKTSNDDHRDSEGVAAGCNQKDEHASVAFSRVRSISDGHYRIPVDL